MGARALPLIQAEVNQANQILPGLRRFEAVHPDWTEEDGGQEGWDPLVAWWALDQSAGLVLIDPLIDDWSRLDRLVQESGGVAGVIRTIHWHERSIQEVAQRYQAQVWAKPPPAGVPKRPFDREIHEEDELFDNLRATGVERADEVALWLPAQRALLFGDAMLRRQDGELSLCPDSWLQPDGGPQRLREILRGLAELPVEHALVAHGPLVLGDGADALRRALA